MELMAVVRAVHTAAVVLLAGGYAFEGLLLPSDSASGLAQARARAAQWCRRIRGGALAVGLASWAAWLVLVAAGMGGLALAQALDARLLHDVLTRTIFGPVWLVRAALMLLLALLLVRRRVPSAVGWVPDPAGAACATALLVSLAWAGHAVATPAPMRPLHLAADVLHLLGAGLWLGTLLPLLLVLGRARDASAAAWRDLAARATRRYSVLGVVAVALLVATGPLNAWLLMGGLGDLLGTLYGRLVCAKLVLLLAMIALATANRWRLAPRLMAANGSSDQSVAAARGLWRNVMLEVLLGAAVVLVAATLSTTAPPWHGAQ